MILLFSAGLILIYTIPNKALEPQYSKSLDQILEEESYPNYLFKSDASILDNFMDTVMIKTCHVSNVYKNVFEAAFDNNGYPRYWNGYLLTLRPIMTQFTYQQIRYINMLILLTAFCLCFSGIHKEFGILMAVGFAVSVLMCFLVLIGESLQYISVFLIMFGVMLLILYCPIFYDINKTGLLFFAAGMAANFFDLLTAPLLTLGIPLILVLSREIRKKNTVQTFISIVMLSVSWCAGYALCWIAKWALGTLILGTNVFDDAMATAKFRVEGNETYPLDRALMFRLNFETYFFAKGRKPLIFTVLILIFSALRIIRSRKKIHFSAFFLSLSIASFPYIWFFVFANHSQLHYFYTYRIQAIAMFAVFAAFSNAAEVHEA